MKICDHAFIFRHVIIGVTSFGTGCAHPDYPGVYARVTEVKSWIQSVASDTQESDCKFQQLSISCDLYIQLWNLSYNKSSSYLGATNYPTSSGSVGKS